VIYRGISFKKNYSLYKCANTDSEDESEDESEENEDDVNYSDSSYDDYYHDYYNWTKTATCSIRILPVVDGRYGHFSIHGITSARTRQIVLVKNVRSASQHAPAKVVRISGGYER
jgi:hypothetical protein